MTGTPTGAGPVVPLLLRARRPAELRLQVAAALAVLAAAAAAALLGSPAAGGVAAFFAAGLLVASIHPGLAVPFLAVATPLGYWRPEIAGIQMPALEAASFGAALACLPRLPRPKDLVRDPAGADVAFAALVAFILLSGAGSQARGEWEHDVVLWASLAVVFAVSHRALRTRAFRRVFLASVAVAAFAESIVAIVQYVEGTSGRFSRLGGAIVYPQPTGTLEHPNAVAPYLVACTLLLAGAALAERRGRRALVVAVAVVVGIGSLVPYSRGGWISLAAGLLAWSGAQRRARSLLVVVGALGSLLAAALLFGGTFGARLSSIVSHRFSDLYGFRLTLADRALHVIVHHPLTGTGVFHETGTYAGRPTLATHPHDLLLGVAVFFGVPAALAFLVLLVAAFRGALRAVVDGPPPIRAEGAGALAVLVVYVVDGLLEYPFWNDSLTVLTVAVFAYTVALGSSARASPRVSMPVGASPTMDAATMREATS